MVKKELQNDHFWRFDDIGRQLTSATYEKSGHPSAEVKVAITEDQFTKHFRYVHPIAADLFDLAEATQLADWWSVPSSTKNGRPRNFRLQIPVRCSELFNKTIVHDQLSELLHFQTRDLWSFEFVPRREVGRPAERSPSLFPDEIDEAALFSCGADSTAGAAGRLLAQPDKRLLLVSVDSENTRLHNAQDAVYQKFRKRFPLTEWLPIRFTRRKVSATQPVNKHFRARGFSFLISGAATALVFDKNKLFVYEHGLGALNLPFRASEIGVEGHARGVHPLSLLYAGRLISALTGSEFHFENPYFYSTKGEMLKHLVEAGLANIVHKTITCDRVRAGDLQCGCCSSCLYRRQGMIWANIDDFTTYRTESLQYWDQSRKNSHFKHMNYQVVKWQQMLDSENPWALFSRRYPSQLNDMVDRVCRDNGQNPMEMAKDVLNLIERHTVQWQYAEPILERTLGFYHS